MKTFFALAALLTAGTAWTGTPDQDPTIAGYRQKFEEAHVPSLAELQLGRTWICDERAAFRNNFQAFGPGRYIRLNERNGMLHNSGPARLDWLQFTVDGLAGTVVTARDHVIFFRITDDGHLVLENTTYRTNPKTQVPSVSAGGRGAFAYGICLKAI